MDFRQYTIYPRGMRNNNVGNLRPDGFSYANQIGKDAQGHAIFPDMVYGVEAMAKDLIYKFKNRSPRLDTIKKFVATYAPASDGNDEALYRKVLRNATGLTDTETIPLNNTNLLVNFFNAVASMEVRADYFKKIPNTDLINGYNAALKKYNLNPVGAAGGSAKTGSSNLFIIVALVVVGGLVVKNRFGKYKRKK